MMDFVFNVIAVDLALHFYEQKLNDKTE